MRNRIVIGLLLTAGFVLLLLAGTIVQVVVFSFAAVIAVGEMTRVLRQKEFSPYNTPLIVAPLLFLLSTFFQSGFFQRDTSFRLSVEAIFILCVLALAIECLFNSRRTISDCMAGFFILVYPLSLFAVLMNLLVLVPVISLLCMFVCPLMGDTFAYFVGSAIGKHKLCPSISPKKTIEGAIASLVGSVAGGWTVHFLCYRLPLWDGLSVIPLGVLLTMGFFCGIFGLLGDLFASRIKRFAGAKDYSNLFPGHGGVMDRLDSVLFCAPVVYYFLIDPWWI